MKLRRKFCGDDEHEINLSRVEEQSLHSEARQLSKIDKAKQIIKKKVNSSDFNKQD